jgi:hypothetical protein
MSTLFSTRKESFPIYRPLPAADCGAVVARGSVPAAVGDSVNADVVTLPLSKHSDVALAGGSAAAVASAEEDGAAG